MKPDFHAINRGLLFHSGIRRWKTIKHKAILKVPLEHININYVLRLKTLRKVSTIWNTVYLSSFITLKTLITMTSWQGKYVEKQDENRDDEINKVFPYKNLLLTWELFNITFIHSLQYLFTGALAFLGIMFYMEETNHIRALRKLRVYGVRQIIKWKNLPKKFINIVCTQDYGTTIEGHGGEGTEAGLEGGWEEAAGWGNDFHEKVMLELPSPYSLPIPHLHSSPRTTCLFFG